MLTRSLYWKVIRTAAKPRRKLHPALITYSHRRACHEGQFDPDCRLCQKLKTKQG